LFNAAKSRTLSDDQLEKVVLERAIACCGQKQNDLEVSIKPSTYYQKGHAHKSKSVRVTFKTHCNDYAFVHKLGQDLS
jgi:uncharacterized protein involved in tolerance to divalent cations